MAAAGRMSENRHKKKFGDIVKYVMSQDVTKVFFLCLILVIFIEILGRHSLIEAVKFIFQSPLRFIMNVFLIYTPFTVFFIFRKRSAGFVLVAFAWAVFGITNGIVLAFRVTPFSTVDFRLAEAAMGVLNNYLEIWQIVLLIVGAVAAIALVVLLIIKIKPYRGPIHRVRNAVMAAGYWVVIYFLMKTLIHAGVFTTVIPNLNYAYKDYGASYCFVVTGMGNGIKKPINYSQDRMENIEKKINRKFKNEEDKTAENSPNIIFLQLESFFDINHVIDYDFNENPVPYYEYLKDHYSTGYLTVPAFGAGTANTEFECITGMDLSYFSPGEYPYKTILKKHTCESMAYDMKQLGYGTHVIHNNTATFYGRNKVFPNLGFDSFSTIETMNSTSTTENGWAKDGILTGEIMKALESTKEKDYIYTISVQGHGDYYKSTAQVQDPEIKVSNVNARDQEDAVNYYVEQISEMDDFLNQLCTTLKNYDEDTVLVLYGDHLPGLGFQGSDLDNHNVYQTEYVIWSNFKMKRKYKNLYAYQLAAEVQSRLGMHDGTLFRFHQRYAGKKYYSSRLRALQYDMLYGRQYIYDQVNPFLETEMRFGVDDVVIDSVYRLQTTDDDRKEKTIIYGGSFTPSSVVRVNGREVDTQMLGTSSLEITEKLKDGDIIDVSQETGKGKILQTSNYFYYWTDRINDSGYESSADAVPIEEVSEDED